jgi:hypothetical protein
MVLDSLLFATVYLVVPGPGVRPSPLQFCLVCSVPSAVKLPNYRLPSSGSTIVRFLVEHDMDVAVRSAECVCVPCLTTISSCDRLEVLLRTDVEKLRLAAQKLRPLMSCSSSAPGYVLILPKTDVSLATSAVSHAWTTVRRMRYFF